MKKYLFLLLLIPLTAFGQRGYRGWGGGASISSLLPIIADSTDWTAGSHVHAIKPKDGKSVEADSGKFGALEVTGNTILDGYLTMVTTASESLRIAAGGIRNEGGLRQKGASVFGATATQATIATTGKITTPDSVAAKLGIRTEGTLRAKGASTFGATATPVVLSTAGKVTAADSIAAGKGIRSEGPALLKGDVTARAKAVIYDSARVNLTSKLIGDVQVGTGTNWFTAADSSLAIEGDISIDGFKVSAIDTVFTATYAPRWVKFTSGAKSWYSPVYADTTGKW